MFSLLLALLLALAAPLAPSPSAIPSRTLDAKFDELKAAFERAGLEGTQDERKSAAEALATSLNVGALAVFSAEHTRVTDIVDDHDAKAFRARGLIERKLILIEQWKLRATRDDSAEGALEREQKALEEQQKDLTRFEKRLALERPWQLTLRESASRLLGSLTPDKRKKLETDLLVDASENPSAAVRRASIDLLGAVGGLDSANGLARLAQSQGEACDKIEDRLPKLMAEVHKLEARLAKEADKASDSFSRATFDQYDTAKKDAAEMRTRAHETARQAQRAASAAAGAIVRLESKQVEDIGATLVRSWKKGKGRGRRMVLSVLSQARVEPIRVVMRAQLAAESEPLARAEWIDGLAAQGDNAIVPELLSKHLSDAAWVVRSRAAIALATLRSKDAIPVLIARLSQEQGRLRTDVDRSLTSLTGQSFRANAELWQRWWQANGASFQVPPISAEKTALEEAKESVGVSFFGISTESQRILFVVDCSLSMNFSMTPKNNPGDEPGKPFDTPDEAKGEYSRLTAAKRDLEKALGGIRDGGEFNIIGYAADVWSWDDTPAVMSAATRKEALTYVSALSGAAGTNIYSALERAFDMSGAKAGSAWVKPNFDTMFFLTDGRATVGLSTDTEEILSYVRERNANCGIVIHTIGLSGAQDADLLSRLATMNGGQYVAR